MKHVGSWDEARAFLYSSVIEEDHSPWGNLFSANMAYCGINDELMIIEVSSS